MEPWEFEERKWQIICRVSGCLIGGILIFFLLSCVARCDHGKPQDPFALICNGLIQQDKKENRK